MAENSTPSPASKPGPKPSNPLAKFPSNVRSAHERFLTTGDVDALDTVVLAVVRDYQPAQLRGDPAVVLPDSARMIDDLGFDSLALAEIVFFFEDLYRVSITNEELMRISSVGELRVFIRSKVDSAKSS
ncbi:MAG: acyl carrier protein [Opitutaceae bacterium]|jgi:acyl carrier protein